MDLGLSKRLLVDIEHFFMWPGVMTIMMMTPMRVRKMMNTAIMLIIIWRDVRSLNPLVGKQRVGEGCGPLAQLG